MNDLGFVAATREETPTALTPSEFDIARSPVRARSCRPTPGTRRVPPRLGNQRSKRGSGLARSPR